jgi:tetratricopeptide (TPR) repeat protein
MHQIVVDVTITVKGKNHRPGQYWQIAGMVMAVVWTLAIPFATFAQDEATMVFNRAEHLRKSNNLIAAIDEYERAIALDGSNPRFPFSKGMCYVTLKDFENAVLAFEQTVKLKPDFVPAYTMLAKCYESLDRFMKVEEALDKAFQHDTDIAKRLKYKESIIQIFIKQENYDRALRHVNDAKAAAPGDPEMLYFEAMINNKKGNYEQAKKAMLSVTATLTTKEPQRIAKYYYELGFAYNKLGEYEKSGEAFNLANFGPYKPLIAKLSPQYYMSAALCYLKLNDFEKCKELLQTALKMQHNFSQAYMMLANIAKMEADQSEAIKIFQQALKAETDAQRQAKIYQSLAQLQLENGKFQDAIKSAEAYLKIDEKDYNVMFIQAMAHYKLKNYKQAVTLFDRLAGWVGLDLETKSKHEFALGIVYKEMKNYDMARQAFKRAQGGSFKTVAAMAEEEIAQETATAKATP